MKKNMMNNETALLNEEELKNVNGGNLDYYPGNDVLCELDLNEIVVSTGGWSDEYYDTLRDDGWKNVGSEDMLRYVARTIGTKDPRYIALAEYSKNGFCRYNGWQID